MKKTSNLRRQIFFDTSVHIKEVKDCISGSNEDKVLKVFDFLGYKQSEDFERQYPIGCRFVLDFAFVKEKFCIEIDGESHNGSKQIKIDRARDKFLYDNGWIVLRIKEKIFFGSNKSFYKFLIRELVEERRKQLNEGRLYHIDIKDYIQEDYE